MARKRLYLIDGSAVFYRSFFAFIRNPRKTSKGEDTSGVFGFALTLLKILDEKPDYLAVVFDRKEPTFRHRMYEPYKATRERMPDEMVDQYPWVEELVSAFNVALIEPPFLPETDDDGTKYTYEADDVIGTVAKQAEAQGFETYMVTGDKDYMQLISPTTFIYNIRPGKDEDKMDAAYVEREIGLKPEQIVDYLALMGDSSDNVPGVPKVGKKTAQQLLSEYGSLEGIYENIESITKKAVKASLEENRELADLSQELVTIDINVPVNVKIESLACKPYDPEVLGKFFEKVEFRTLADRLLGEGAVDLTAGLDAYDEKKQTYELVNSPSAFETFMKELSAQSSFVFDTETTGLDAFIHDVIGVAFAWEEGTAYYVPLNGLVDGLTADEVWGQLKSVFENPDIGKAAQNAKFDALMLLKHGIEVRGIDFDTMIASFLLTSNSRENGLDALAARHLNYKMISIESLIGKKGKDQKTMEDVPVDIVSTYAGEDADITLRLRNLLAGKLTETGVDNLFDQVEVPLIEVLMRMEANGVNLDVAFLKEMSNELKGDIARLKDEIYELAGEEFNIKSPQQLGKVLFDNLEIHAELNKRKPAKTATGQYKTSEDILSRYRAHPVVDKILDYRKVTKLKSTYVDALPKLVNERTHRLHTSFNQTVAATGRLSSHDPNLQNIPIRGQKGREIRKGFVPSREDSVILSADYSQVELRMMAHISGDEALQTAFERGEDIHTTTAAAIFQISKDEVEPDHRRKAKEVNFGIIYGISRFGLASRLNITAAEAADIIQSYFTRFPKVNEYIVNIIATAKEQGYVETLMKRRRYIPEINNRNGAIRQNAERVAINTTIQGSAADLIKMAMINIHRRLEAEKLETRMLLQVHDELVFEVPNSEIETVTTLVREEMEGAMKLSVPLKVDVGTGANWLEAH